MIIVFFIFIISLIFLYQLKKNFYIKIIFLMLYIKILDYINSILDKYFRNKNIIETDDSFIVNYSIQGNQYILKINKPIIKNTYMFLDENNIDVTDSIIKYAGPNNIHKITPDSLNFELLKKLDEKDQTIFYKNDILNF